jgi:hypothetical protein
MTAASREDKIPPMATVLRLMTTRPGRQVIHHSMQAAWFAGHARIDPQRIESREIHDAEELFDFSYGFHFSDKAREPQNHYLWVARSESANAIARMKGILGVSPTDAERKYNALCSDLGILRRTLLPGFIELYDIISKEFGLVDLRIEGRDAIFVVNRDGLEKTS